MGKKKMQNSRVPLVRFGLEHSSQPNWSRALEPNSVLEENLRGTLEFGPIFVDKLESPPFASVLESAFQPA